MMNRIVFVISFIWIAFVASAQNASEILDKAAQVYEQSQGIKANFSLHTSIPQQGVSESFEGTIQMRGDKFKLETPDMITWYDGSTQWAYVLRTEEVNVSTPGGDELQVTNPAVLLRSYKKYKYALVIGAEKLSSIVDWQDRSTCVLFGDGASAVILERDDSLPDSEDCLVASELGAAGIYSELLYLPAGGSAMPASHETVEQRQHYIKMTGQELFKLAVNGMVGACRTTMKESGVKSEDVTWVVPHQANMRIIGAVAQRLTIPEERVFVNIDKYGNTSAASIGICLDELCRSGKIKRGDYILLTAFGGGLTWGAMLLRW